MEGGQIFQPERLNLVWSWRFPVGHCSQLVSDICLTDFDAALDGCFSMVLSNVCEPFSRLVVDLWFAPYVFPEGLCFLRVWRPLLLPLSLQLFVKSSWVGLEQVVLVELL